MISSSNSSAIYSRDNMSMSSHRDRDNYTTGAKPYRRNAHLVNYSQILGKESGGI